MQDTTVTPFYLQSFVASAPGSSQPTTEFPSGAGIAFTWDSNGSAFTIYAAQDSQPVYRGTATSFTLAGGRTRSTTFILAASVTGGPASGTPNPSFETIYLYDALTIAIADPAITPSAVTTAALTVSGTSALQGDATLADATVAGTLTVSGATALNGGATAASLTVAGATTLNGAATVGDLTVNGALSVPATASLGAATISALSVVDGLAMMNPAPIAPGSYTASTDGLVVGVVGGGNSCSDKCLAWISGTSGNVTVAATGGNVCTYESSSHYVMASNPNSFVLPVQKGQAWSIGVTQDSHNDEVAPTWFYWIPFGKSATLRTLSAAETAAVGVTPRPMGRSWESRPPEPDLAIAELVDVVTAMAGGSVPDDQAERFGRAVRELVTHSQPG